MQSIIQNFSKLVLVCIILFSMQTVKCQSFSDSLMQDENDIIVSIAPYSQDVRNAILDVSQYPQLLVKLERIQTRSSQSFQDLIAKYSQTEQEKFYETIRFPDLINQLVNMGQKSLIDIQPFLKEYPQKTQDAIADVYFSRFDDLVTINKLYKSSQDALAKVTSSYPPKIQQSFQKVISMPDVMSLLTDNINLTVSLGESYQDDPTGITHQLDSLSGTLTTQNAKELDTYKKEVQNNPQLQEEMKKAANDYSASNGQTTTYVNYNTYDNYAYPYWFGYPSWYSSPIWYPQPLYYQTGYYIGSGGAVVVVGLPSRGYSNWFFNYGYNRYPLVYNHYRSYYNFHRNNFNSRNYFGFHNSFNYAAHSHFSNFGGRNRNYMNRENRNMNFRGNNQMNNQPRQQNFNNRGFDHFNAGSFHNSGWDRVGGGGNRGFGGGNRGFGGGGGFGGGNHGGGGFGGGGHGGGRR